MFEQDMLLDQLGSAYTRNVVQRLQRFAFLPDGVLDSLAESALSENWGNRNYVLEKYLAVHVPWSMEQGRYTSSENQFYVAAGHLQTRYGTPLYLVFEKNSVAGREPWRLVHAGPRVSAPELPLPPDLADPLPVSSGAEIVMSHDHILGENAERVAFLSQTPPVAQICAVAGAIQWSLHRGLHLPYWYYGNMNYVVPLYLQSRENIALSPDLIAPIQVGEDSLLVRTVLPPTWAYPNCRVAVKRHDQLPPWLLDSWAKEATTLSEERLDDPEARTL